MLLSSSFQRSILPVLDFPVSARSNYSRSPRMVYYIYR